MRFDLADPTAPDAQAMTAEEELQTRPWFIAYANHVRKSTCKRCSRAVALDLAPRGMCKTGKRLAERCAESLDALQRERMGRDKPGDDGEKVPA